MCLLLVLSFFMLEFYHRHSFIVGKMMSTIAGKTPLHNFGWSTQVFSWLSQSSYDTNFKKAPAKLTSILVVWIGFWLLFWTILCAREITLHTELGWIYRNHSHCRKEIYGSPDGSRAVILSGGTGFISFLICDWYKGVWITE